MHTDTEQRTIADNPYTIADAQLTGRCAQSRVIANNTRLERRESGAIAVRLHSTDVVTLNPDGSITLGTGGWYTVTTKERINRYLPAGFSLHSDKGRWFLTDHRAGWQLGAAIRYPFAEGMTIHPDGWVQGVDVLAAAEADDANKATRKAIAAYLKGITPRRIIDAWEDSGGDCWLCKWPGREDEAEHLALHVEENYFLATLALNAIVAKGYRHPDVIMAMIYADAQRGRVDRTLTMALRRYLSRALIVGAVTVK